jgi:putative membrane protein
MERKLYRGIMNPSMLATVGLGLWMLIEGWNRYFHQATWMHIKLFLVILLVGYHLACGHMMRRFAADLNLHTDRYYRVFNELPVIILVAVVLLAILKQPL